jgi:RNA polymerase sigma-70 factor (ECF subfamily)
MEDAPEHAGDLVSRVIAGDAAAASRLVDLLHPVVIRIVRHHLPNGMDERDLAQEVFLRVFAKLESFRRDRPLEHWVARLTRNLCFDHLRRQRRRGELRCADLTEAEERLLEAASARDAGPPPGTDSTSDVTALVGKLLRTLRPDEERVLRLLDLEDRPVKEIAALLGWGESRVKVTAFRARRKLRLTLRSLEPGLESPPP